VDQPKISVGTRAEYAYWLSRWRGFLVAQGGQADDIEQVDARFNFEDNRIVLYCLTDPSDERSVAETIAHEYLHALLEQIGETRAARELDLVSKPVRSGSRVGGI
jgi:hypothetical protein